MTRFVSTVVIMILGVVVLGAAAPGIAAILNALVPLVVVVGLVGALVRIVWVYTRRW